MGPLKIPRVALSVLASLVLIPLLVSADDEEWVRPYDGLLPVPSGERNVSPAGGLDASTDFAGTRILDRTTGQPIPGARLRYFEEDVSGFCTRYTYAPASEAVADEQGFAWIPLPTPPVSSHWVADAPGYTPVQEYGRPEVTTLLSAGRDVTARLVDAFGRPLASVEVEWWMGCPHGTALDVTRTAADGTFTLHAPNLEAYVWFHAPPGSVASLGHDVGDLLWLGSRRVDRVLRPGITVRGRVTDPQGRPRAGVVVRSDQGTRGPAVATGADGSFVLAGVRAGDDLRVYDPLRRDADPAVVEGAVEETPVAIRLGPEGAVWDDAPDGALEITLETDAGPFAGNASLRLIAADGRSWVERASFDGSTVDFVVPGGRYVLTDATPFEPLAVPPTAVEVVPEGEARVRIRGRLRLPVEVDGRVWSLAVAGHERFFQNEEEPAHLDPDVEAAVRWGETIAPVGPPQDGVRRAVVRPPRGHTITLKGREIEFAYLTLAGEETWLECDTADGRVTTRAAGPVVLHAETEDGEFVVPLVLPLDERVDLVLDPAPLPVEETGATALVRFPHPDGTPAEHANLRVWGMPTGGGSTPWDAAASMSVFGAESPEEVKVPCRVVLDVPGWATLEARIAAEGEHVLTWGTATLRLTVEDPDGEPAEAVVQLDGHLYRTERGRLDVAGLGTGPHEAVVTPTTHRWRGVEMRTVLGEAEVRTKAVRFTTR